MRVYSAVISWSANMHIADRFMTHVQCEPNSGCWLWDGVTNDRGYGVTERRSYGEAKAHRAAWRLFIGPMDRGICVLHKCDVPSCVNPDHLFLGTRLENSKDMVRKGRSLKGRKKPPTVKGSKLTIDQVSEIKKDRLISGEKMKSIGVRYGVTEATISRILNNKMWS